MNWNKINLKVYDEALLLNWQIFWTVPIVLSWCKNMTCWTVAVCPSSGKCLKISLVAFALITLALMIMSAAWIEYYYSATLTIQQLVLSRFLDFGSSISIRYFDPRQAFGVVLTFISWDFGFNESSTLVFEGVCNTDVTILMIWCFLDCSWSLTLQFIHLVHLEERHFCCQGTHISSMQMQSQFPKCCDSKPRQRRTEGGSTPTPKFRRPSKIMPNSTRLWKLLKIAEFRTPTP